MLSLIPLLIYLIVLFFVLNVRINYLLFTLTYLLGSFTHILIGFFIAHRTKTIFQLSLTYTIYIILFSLIPFLYLYNFMPEILNYFLIFSPAYLNSILLLNIQIGYIFSDSILIAISIILQLLATVSLFYLLSVKKKRGLESD
jgi:hypothetical protein